MIAIQSVTDDSSTNDVLDWIFYYGKENILRLNDEISIDSISIDKEINVSYNNNDFNPLTLNSYWYRRGGFVNTALKKSSQFDYYTDKLTNPFHQEISAAFSNLNLFPLNNTLGKFSDNSLDKLQMLIIAKKVGLTVPKTIVTGNISKLNAFISLCDGKVITKALNKSIYPIFRNDQYHCSITLSTKLIDPYKFKNLTITTGTAALFQQYIEKHYEIRVFYLRRKTFAMAIFSQKNEKTKVDYRHYDRSLPNRAVPYILPKKIHKKIQNFMDVIGLETGSIDLICTPKGKYVFLEVNPIGQYQWVEKNCNYPISKEIANELMKNG